MRKNYGAIHFFFFSVTSSWVVALNSDSCQYTSLLKAVAKSFSLLFAIAFNSKEIEINIFAIVKRARTIWKQIEKKKTWTNLQNQYKKISSFWKMYILIRHQTNLSFLGHKTVFLILEVLILFLSTVLWKNSIIVWHMEQTKASIICLREFRFGNEKQVQSYPM